MTEPLATAEGQFIHPVCVDLVASVEIRWATELIRGPSIDNGAKPSELRHAFGVGADVQRLREGVVKIHLEPVFWAAANNQLAGVVCTLADAGPCVERGELRIVELERSTRLTCRYGGWILARLLIQACWKTERVKVKDAVGLTERAGTDIAGVHGVHALRGGRIRSAGTGGGRKEIFPVGDGLNLGGRDTSVKVLRERGGGGEIVHT